MTTHDDSEQGHSCECVTHSDCWAGCNDKCQHDINALMDAQKTLHKENVVLRAALVKIAAYDDGVASVNLAKHGSHSIFDEPNSVQIARAHPEKPAAELIREMLSALKDCIAASCGMKAGNYSQSTLGAIAKATAHLEKEG